MLELLLSSGQYELLNQPFCGSPETDAREQSSQKPYIHVNFTFHTPSSSRSRLASSFWSRIKYPNPKKVLKVLRGHTIHYCYFLFQMIV